MGSGVRAILERVVCGSQNVAPARFFRYSIKYQIAVQSAGGPGTMLIQGSGPDPALLGQRHLGLAGGLDPVT